MVRKGGGGWGGLVKKSVALIDQRRKTLLKCPKAVL